MESTPALPVLISTVFSAFELLPATLDVELLAHFMWNCELERTQALEAKSLTFRLPIVQVRLQQPLSSDGESVVIARNVVAVIRASGSVIVSSSGSVEAAEPLCRFVFRKIAEALCMAVDAGGAPCIKYVLSNFRVTHFGAFLRPIGDRALDGDVLAKLDAAKVNAAFANFRPSSAGFGLGVRVLVRNEIVEGRVHVVVSLMDENESVRRVEAIVTANGVVAVQRAVSVGDVELANRALFEPVLRSLVR